MEISKGIITDGIDRMVEYYGKIKDLFAENDVENDIQKCPQIDVKLETLEQLRPSKINPNKKRYPDLKFGYGWLKECSDKIIYIFSVTGFKRTKSDIKGKFEELKKSFKLSLCRVNEDAQGWDKPQDNEPVCLYVGSSKDIVQRLKEHLFLCNPTAYAMHLETWFPKDLSITINIWDFSKFLEGKDHDFLQSIEDLLWARYEPLFGRQGKK